MLLHLVNRSPYQHSALHDCLARCSAEDGILLTEDGVYAALANSPHRSALESSGATIYVLQADLEARGLMSDISPSATSVDERRFVQLTLEYDNVVSWF